MIQLKTNQQLLDKHISEIVPKIKRNIEAINRDELSAETIDCLNYLNHEKEIQNLLSANTSQLKLYMKFFEDEYPNSIGVKKQKKKFGTSYIDF